jgi:hypothetical protein
MSITQYLNTKKFFLFESYSQQCPEQEQDLIELTSKTNLNVMEIGFNAGHSAELFLENNKTLTLTSFDIGTQPYLTLTHAK